MLKITAITSVVITTTLSTYLFSYDIFNANAVAWIHYIIPFTVGMIFAASSVMLFLDSQ
jgi:hypothetical protein